MAPSATQEPCSAAEQQLVAEGAWRWQLTQMATSVGKAGLAGWVKADKLCAGCKFIGLGFPRYVATSCSCFQELFGMAPNSKAEITGKPPENPCLNIWGLLTWFHHFQAKIFWIAHAIKPEIWSAQTRVHLQVPLSPQNGSLWLLLGHCSDSTSSMVSGAVRSPNNIQVHENIFRESAVVGHLGATILGTSVGKGGTTGSNLAGLCIPRPASFFTCGFLLGSSPRTVDFKKVSAHNSMIYTVYTKDSTGKSQGNHVWLRLFYSSFSDQKANQRCWDLNVSLNNGASKAFLLLRSCALWFWQHGDCTDHWLLCTGAKWLHVSNGQQLDSKPFRWMAVELGDVWCVCGHPLSAQLHMLQVAVPVVPSFPFGRRLQAQRRDRPTERKAVRGSWLVGKLFVTRPTKLQDVFVFLATFHTPRSFGFERPSPSIHFLPARENLSPD